MFLLAGPATNITSLTVLIHLLGRRATLVYLLMVALGAVVSGLVVDWLYVALDLQVQAQLGVGAELISEPLQRLAAIALLCLTLPVAVKWFRRQLPCH